MANVRVVTMCTQKNRKEMNEVVYSQYGKRKNRLDASEMKAVGRRIRKNCSCGRMKEIRQRWRNVDLVGGNQNVEKLSHLLQNL